MLNKLHRLLSIQNKTADNLTNYQLGIFFPLTLILQKKSP